MTMKEAAEKLTRQEAAKKLKTFCHACYRYPQCVHTDPICFKSLEMAINALEQPPLEKVLGDIKGEIDDLPSYLTEDGRRMVRKCRVHKIIDSHIRGKEHQ